MLKLVALVCGLVVALVANATNASTLTFRFETTINASSVGGSSSAPLVAEYSFDSSLVNGSGPVSTGPTVGSYGPVSGLLSVGGETVTFDGSINVFNQATQDTYNVLTSSFSGTLFGLTPTTFRFALLDTTAGMLSDTSLPLDIAFALNSQTAEIILFFGARRNLNGNHTDYSLELVSTPIPAALPLFATGLGVLAFLARRRKRKNAAPLAAA